MSEAEPAEEPQPSAMPELADEVRRQYESDMDSLHVLPLNIIPFELPGLKRPHLIKNVCLDTVIELFKDDSAGNGQVRVEEATKLFGIPEKEPHPDIIKLKRVRHSTVSTSIRFGLSCAISACRSTTMPH